MTSTKSDNRPPPTPHPGLGTPRGVSHHDHGHTYDGGSTVSAVALAILIALALIGFVIVGDLKTELAAIQSQLAAVRAQVNETRAVCAGRAQ